jgi:hypothetical protein
MRPFDGQRRVRVGSHVSVNPTLPGRFLSRRDCPGRAGQNGLRRHGRGEQPKGERLLFHFPFSILRLSYAIARPPRAPAMISDKRNDGKWKTEI